MLSGRINWFGAAERLLSQENKTGEKLRKINSHQQKETGTGFDRRFVLLESVAGRQRYPPSEEKRLRQVPSITALEGRKISRLFEVPSSRSSPGGGLPQTEARFHVKGFSSPE